MNVIAFRRPDAPAPDEDLLVERYRWLVELLARRMSRRRRSLDFATLEADGFFGLVLAIRRYDPARGCSLGTYATKKIVGAMKDGIRRDFIEARRSRATDAERAAHLASNEREQAVAASVGAVRSRDEGRLQRRLQVISIEDLVTPPSVAPLGTDTMLFARLQRLLSQLSSREQDVIRMLYFEGRTVYHVASTLGISPGLVSRTHGVVLDKLRRLLLPTDPQLAKVA